MSVKNGTNTLLKHFNVKLGVLFLIKSQRNKSIELLWPFSVERVKNTFFSVLIVFAFWRSFPTVYLKNNANKMFKALDKQTTKKEPFCFLSKMKSLSIMFYWQPWKTIYLIRDSILGSILKKTNSWFFVFTMHEKENWHGIKQLQIYCYKIKYGALMGCWDEKFLHKKGMFYEMK